MTSSFSARPHHTFHQSRVPLGQFIQGSQLSSRSFMSFAPQMDGSFQTHPPFLDQGSTSFIDVSEATANKIAELQAKLERKLGPEYISQRPGPGGGPKLTYAEGWKIINLANEVFGFNGWSSSVVNLNTDFIDFSEESRRYSVGVSAVVRVTLRDGVFHEDVGYGMLENSKSKGSALDKCKKEAVTDAVKRALRNFGNLLGNCLYDKAYTHEVVKMKVPPAKFDESTLHRRSDFKEPGVPTGKCITPATETPRLSVVSKQTPFKSAMVNPYPKPLNATKTTNMPIATHSEKSTYNNPTAPHIRTNVNNGSIKSNMGPPARPKPATAQVTLKSNANLKSNASAMQDSFNNSGVLGGRGPVSLQTHALQNRISSLDCDSLGHLENPVVPVHERVQPALAPKASLQSQDMYAFTSDDDAFFAGIDLSECNGGMNNDVEADLGQPIHIEGSMDSIVESSDRISPENKKLNEKSNSETNASLGYEGGKVSVNRQIAIHAIQGQQHQSSNQSTAVHCLEQPQKHEFSPAADSNDDSKQENRQKVGNNLSSNQGSSASVSALNKSRVASLGGFSFPNRIGREMAWFDSGEQPQQGVQKGVKRDADTMHSSTSFTTSSNMRSSTSGMGLAKAQSNGHPNNRQPLAPLQLDGNDVKRIRR